MTYAVTIIMPPTDLPRNLYPDQRPKLYVANADDAKAAARLDQMISDIESGKIDPTPGRKGWMARRLISAEIDGLIAMGDSLSSKYVGTAIDANPEIPGVLITRLA